MSTKARSSLFFLFGLALFFLLVAADPEDFSARDIVYFSVVAVIVLILQLAFAIIMHQFAGWVFAKIRRNLSTREKIQRLFMDLVLTIFTLSNSYFFLLVTMSSSRLEKLIIGIIIMIMFAAFLRIHGLYRAAIVFTITLIGLGLGQYGLAAVRSNHASVLTNSIYSALDDRKISDKRNIYLIFYDALVSRDALQKLYGTVQVPHLEALEELGFRVYDGVSADQLTLQSFARIISGNPLQPYPSVDSLRRIIGGVNSPSFYNVFKNNGYRIQLLFNSQYVIRETKGIDFVLPRSALNVDKFSLQPGSCGFQSRRFLYFACLGSFHETNFSQKVIERLKIGSDIDFSPSFTFAYLFFPRHTSIHSFSGKNETDVKRYVSDYLERAKQLPDKYFGPLVREIRKNDPNGIIVIAGDHGAWLTRGMSPKEAPFFYLDRYGVAVGISPKDFCMEKLKRGTTLYTLIPDILSCLEPRTSNDESKIDVGTLPEDLIRALKSIDPH